jgi:hypothetical protein
MSRETTRVLLCLASLLLISLMPSPASGAPASAANGATFTVTAASNETGSAVSVPTITASGSCTAGSVSNTSPGSYQATITMDKRSGTCTTTAKWAATSDYLGETQTQKTAAN